MVSITSGSDSGVKHVRLMKCFESEVKYSTLVVLGYHRLYSDVHGNLLLFSVDTADSPMY